MRPVLITNDEGYLCAAARDGHGIVQLALPIVADALQAGELVPVLEEFSLVERWVKIMVPTARLELTRLRPRVLIDAAHNVDSARALAEELRRWRNRPCATGFRGTRRRR